MNMKKIKNKKYIDACLAKKMRICVISLSSCLAFLFQQNTIQIKIIIICIVNSLICTRVLFILMLLSFHNEDLNGFVFQGAFDVALEAVDFKFVLKLSNKLHNNCAGKNYVKYELEKINKIEIPF
jgi:hypothetical protein